MGRLFAIVVVMLALVGCASSGQKMEEGALQELEPGVTTLADMTREFGQPVAQTFDSEGNLVVNWVYVHVGYMNIGSEQQTLSAMFDGNKVLERYSLSQGAGPGTRLGY